MLEIEIRLAAFAIFWGAITTGVGRGAQLVWLQTIGFLVLLTGAALGFYALPRLRKCGESVTPAIERIRRTFGSFFAASVLAGLAGLFILVVRANTSRAWSVFAIVSVTVFAGLYAGLTNR